MKEELRTTETIHGEGMFEQPVGMITTYQLSIEFSREGFNNPDSDFRGHPVHPLPLCDKQMTLKGLSVCLRPGWVSFHKPFLIVRQISRPTQPVLGRRELSGDGIRLVCEDASLQPPRDNNQPLVRVLSNLLYDDCSSRDVPQSEGHKTLS